jgi:hypothetical protein
VERQTTKKSSHPFPKKIYNINSLLKIWACWLLKIICPCNFYKVCGWNALHLCPRFVFPSLKQFSQEIFLKLVEKTK